MGAFVRDDGSKGQLGGALFELDRLYTIYGRDVTLDPDIIGLPWI